MLTPEQAILTAHRDGYCRISHDTYLWSKSHAEAQEPSFSDIQTPFVMVTKTQCHLPPETIGVKTSKDRNLVKKLKNEQYSKSL